MDQAQIVYGTPSTPPPAVTDAMIGRMTKAGPRYNVEWLEQA